MRVVEAIAERIAAHPEGRVSSFAVPARPRTATPAQLWERSAGLAAGLLDLPPGPLAVLAEDVCDLTPAVWAGLRSGRTVLPVAGAARSALAGRRRAWESVARINPAVVVADPTFATLLADVPSAVGLLLDDVPAGVLPRDVPEAEPALLIQTSGSTGTPRFAALSADALYARGFRLGVKPETVVSGFGLDTISIIRPVMADTDHFVHLPPSRSHGDPRSLLDAAEATRATGLLMSTGLARLVLANAHDHTWDLSSLRWISWGLEPIAPATVRAFVELMTAQGARDLRIKRGYGSTESGLISSGESNAHEPLPADVGTMVEGRSVRIVNGRIQVQRNRATFSGYAGEPLGTDDGFTADGWWDTGDLGTLRDGVVTLTGRAKEIVISHGAKYSLPEIDAAVETAHPGVRSFAFAADAATDTGTIERLGIAVVAERPVVDDVRTFVADAFGLTPEPLVQIAWADVPVASNGKVQRSELAARFSDHAPASVSSGRSRYDSPAAALWRRVLDLTGPLDREARFATLGGDSLRAAQLLASVENDLGVRVPVEEFFAEPTLGRLEALVEQPPRPATAEESRADELVRLQLTHVATWPGERPTNDPLLTGLNLAGTRPPLAWVFQGAAEFQALAGALGSDQPLYGLRSGHTLMRYDEDDIQVFALRYARALAAARPDGPIFLGGNCQGAVIALAVAQQLVRRGRSVPLLSLLDWSTGLQPYTGRVLILHGHAEQRRVRYLQNTTGRQDGHRLFDHATTFALPAGHGEYFRPGTVDVLADALRHHLDAPATRRRFRLSRRAPMRRMQP